MYSNLIKKFEFRSLDPSSVEYYTTFETEKKTFYELLLAVIENNDAEE